ncbi:MAG: hypothetical protein IIU46_03985 [Treponema sp.]|nr:hypothetical protein [Treponema sp.]
MKKILTVFAAVFTILSLNSCASNPSTGKKVYAVNNVPKILNAGFSYELEEKSINPVKQVKADEPMYMFVSVRDSGFDVSRIEVTAVRDEGEEDTQIINLNKIDGEEFIYGVEVSFNIPGNWKFCFYVFDEDENRSEAFRTSLEVFAR